MIKEQIIDIMQNSLTTCYSCALPSQLAKEQLHWLVRREEVVMTSEVEVGQAKECGVR